jgi:hypothetical protein
MPVCENLLTLATKEGLLPSLENFSLVLRRTRMCKGHACRPNVRTLMDVVNMKIERLLFARGLLKSLP